MSIEIHRVDERDNNWEDSQPRFRVYLHHGDDERTGGATETVDITGADVLQVIDWAQRQADGTRTYAIALVRDDAFREAQSPGEGRGLVWLLGMDGNDVPMDQHDVGVQERMLARRHAPVVIPSQDAMP